MLDTVVVLDTIITAGRVFLSATDRNRVCNASIYATKLISLSLQSNYNNVETTVSFFFLLVI